MDEDEIAALIERLGESERTARQIAEIGESILPRVDAIAADVRRPMHVRRTASVAGHHIRDRAMRAPPAPPRPAPVIPQEQVEARAFLEGGGRLRGDGFLHHDAREYVAGLYAAGATRVMVADRARALVVELPGDAAARTRLFELYNAEIERCGEEFGGEEAQGHELTREEALVMGVPEAEGEWVVDDFHAHDTGQGSLRFAWA